VTIDWSNPTVQGAFIAAMISLVGVILAAAAGFAGAILGSSIAARATRQAVEVERHDAEAARIRAWNVRRIEQTRQQLVALTDGFLALMDKDLARATALLRRQHEPPLANARLLGDVEALRMAAAAVARTQGVLQGNPILRNLQLAAINPFTDEDRAAMFGARAGILNALERQQERVLRDEPLVELTAEQILAIPELAAADGAIQRFANP